MVSGSVDSGCHELSENYDLYGLKHHIVEISGDVTDAGRTDGRTNDKPLSLAIIYNFYHHEMLIFSEYFPN